jgi:hypothetical protein
MMPMATAEAAITMGVEGDTGLYLFSSSSGLYRSFSPEGVSIT